MHVTLSFHILQTVSQPLEDPGSCIVPPGVPFKLPCPICRWPLELGQYCTHHQNITILHYSIEDPLEDYLCQPFRHLRNIHFTELDNTQRSNLSDQENVPPYPSSPLHLHTAMPILHLPVSENQFPVNKHNFMFIKVNIEESLEYVELQDMPLNEELDLITMTNLCFTVFKDLVPVLDLQSQFSF